jgi:hypothetical protein
MTSSQHSNPRATGLPEELRGLTYEQATPEQVAHMRKRVRAQLADADARWSEQEREQRRAAFLNRLNAA